MARLRLVAAEESPELIAQVSVEDALSDALVSIRRAIAVTEREALKGGLEILEEMLSRHLGEVR
jgi:hypothetical protein